MLKLCLGGELFNYGKGEPKTEHHSHNEYQHWAGTWELTEKPSHLPHLLKSFSYQLILPVASLCCLWPPPERIKCWLHTRKKRTKINTRMWWETSLHKTKQDTFTKIPYTSIYRRLCTVTAWDFTDADILIHVKLKTVNWPFEIVGIL